MGTERLSCFTAALEWMESGHHSFISSLPSNRLGLYVRPLDSVGTRAVTTVKAAVTEEEKEGSDLFTGRKI